jgi:cell cycle arrest protein BUB2
MPSDSVIRSRVSEASLLRILNAFAQAHASENDLLLPPPRGKFSYVQGMNVLLAPLVAVLGEVDAFFAFEALILHHVPRYVQPTLDGAHAGASLLDNCLRTCDPELHAHLSDVHHLSTLVYAFPVVLSLMASIPPLQQTIRHWDFLLAAGVTINIVSITALLVSMRARLLESDSPMRLLQNLPPVDADALRVLTMRLAARLPADLSSRIATHSTFPPPRPLTPLSPDLAR